MDWFLNKPLLKKQILVTRALDQARSFVDLLENKGAFPILFPTIETVPPDSWKALDHAIQNINNYDWIIFTSANGAKYFLERLEKNRVDIKDLRDIRLCAIGPKTAGILKKSGIKIDYIPSEFKAEGVIEELISKGIKGKKILIPRASIAREILPEELKNMGAFVEAVDTYKTIQPAEKTDDIRKMLKNKEIDMITFTSSSTVTNFVNMFKKEEIFSLIHGVDIACIGPITAKTVEKYNLQPHIIPDDYTIEALTQAIVDFYQKNKIKS